MAVGVLALQGGFALHVAALQRVGIEAAEVRDGAALADVVGLVIPGGESTAIARLLDRADMLAALRAVRDRGVPILATCAGLILAASPGLSWLDVDVTRNAYGTQRDSAVVWSDDGRDELVLIRAPQIERVGAGVEVLARHQGCPVLVRQGSVFGATFHPELSPGSTLHARVFTAA